MALINFFISDLTFDKDLFDSVRLEIGNLFISSKEININENHKNKVIIDNEEISVESLKLYHRIPTTGFLFKLKSL